MSRVSHTQSTGTQTRKIQAVKIYADIIPANPRQLVINQLINKLGMTKSGASTYYANMKTGKWDVAISGVRTAGKIARNKNSIN